MVRSCASPLFIFYSAIRNSRGVEILGIKKVFFFAGAGSFKIIRGSRKFGSTLAKNFLSLKIGINFK